MNHQGRQQQVKTGWRTEQGELQFWNWYTRHYRTDIVDDLYVPSDAMREPFLSNSPLCIIKLRINDIASYIHSLQEVMCTNL